MWSKVVDALELQVLLPKGYGSIVEANEWSHIIQNLLNNLGQKLGALKYDGIHGWWMVCTIATLENIRCVKAIAKVLGVD
jgi:hypothetical protein